MATYPIHGSVIQRTFISERLPASVAAATVPIDEIGTRDPEEADGEFRNIVSEITGVPPNTLLEAWQYKAFAANTFKNEPYIMQHHWEPWEREWATGSQPPVGGETFRLFAEHAIPLLLVPYGALLIHEPTHTRQFLDLKMDDTAFGIASSCFMARVDRSVRLAEFAKALLESDIPYGHSPKTSSDSLLKLLDTGKKMCLAPLGIGGSVGITQLTQGHYVAAILSTGTGSAMTLILLGSVAVGSLLIDAVARRRTHTAGEKATVGARRETQGKKPGA